MNINKFRNCCVTLIYLVLPFFSVQEGLFLKGKQISPYAGDTYHETPITLLLAELLGGLPEMGLFLVFIICDILTAVILAFAVEEARSFYVSTSGFVQMTVLSVFSCTRILNVCTCMLLIFQLMRSQKESKYLSEAKQLEIKEDESYSPYVIMSYLLNPFCVMNCVGQTTTVFGNLISAISIFSMLKGYMKHLFPQ